MSRRTERRCMCAWQDFCVWTFLIRLGLGLPLIAAADQHVSMSAVT